MNKERDPMIIIASDWRSLALRGAAAVLFGITALVWPGITLLALVLLWGAYVLVDGVSTLYALVKGTPDARERGGLLAMSAAASIIAGGLTFLWPGITALVLLYIMAAWALMNGVLEIVGGIQLRKAINDEWRWVLGGVLSIAFGAILVIAPGAGALAVTWLIGWFAMLNGALVLSLAWKARSLDASVRTPSPLRTRRSGQAQSA
jgi:uncharacterized membrane protein HdeD (DUF308 family)